MADRAQATALRDGARDDRVADGSREGNRERRAARHARQRAQILEAAEEILREGGAAALGMRQLAVRSGVGHVTPYKLFGSKRAVLRALLDRFVAPHVASLLTPADGDAWLGMTGRQERLLDIVETDCEYVRELLAALDDAAPRNNRDAWMSFRSASLRQDLERMREAGLVRADAPIEVVAHEIFVAYVGAFRRWILGTSSVAQLRREHRAAILTAALAAATERGRERLWPELVALGDPPTDADRA